MMYILNAIIVISIFQKIILHSGCNYYNIKLFYLILSYQFLKPNYFISGNANDIQQDKYTEQTLEESERQYEEECRRYTHGLAILFL